MRRIREKVGPDKQIRVRVHHDDDASFKGLVYDYIQFMGWKDTTTEGYDHNASCSTLATRVTGRCCQVPMWSDMSTQM